VLPEIAESMQRCQQSLVVARMEADCWFVEHVQHSRQPGADLRREADALGFATRQGRAGAGEGEVVEPDIDQELQSGADLAEHLARPPADHGP
jgi:hypothetical protein